MIRLSPAPACVGPTNQCAKCGARYPHGEPRCLYHVEVDVWVRGCLVRSALVLRSSESGEPADHFIWAEIVHQEYVDVPGARHFRAWRTMQTRAGQMTQAERDAIIAAFWAQEEYPDECEVWFYTRATPTIEEAPLRSVGT